MFERYTESARRAIFFAHCEAVVREAPAISPLHLLLGILHGKDPVTSLALDLPAKLQPICNLIDLPERKHTALPDRKLHPPLDRDSKIALAWAAKEADLDDVLQIDNNYLIRGLLRFSNPAQAVLNSVGIELKALRAAAESGRLKIPLHRRIGFFFLRVLKESVWPALWKLGATFLAAMIVLLLLRWLGIG